MNKNIILELSVIEDNILDIVNNWNEYTTSDLQGAIQVQVRNAFDMGFINGHEEATKGLIKELDEIIREWERQEGI
jgi:hypothetical protein